MQPILLLAFTAAAFAASTVYLPLASPRALRAGPSAPVAVSVRIAGKSISNVQLFLVGSHGTTFLTQLRDDGHKPDLRASDYVFTGSAMLGLSSPGVQRFRVTAFVDGRTLTSLDNTLESFAAGVPITRARGTTAALVRDPATGDQLACDELSMLAPAGTDPARLDAALRAERATLAGLVTLPAFNIWTVRLPCAATLSALEVSARNLTAAGWNAELVPAMSFDGVPVTDPLMQSFGAEQLRRTEAPLAWNVTLGSTALVAVVDTGALFDQPDLQGRLIRGENFAGFDADDLSDNVGHGTEMASLIAGNTFDDAGIAGIAPQAQVLVVKISNSGVILASRAVNGMEYAMQEGAKIINCSFSSRRGDKMMEYIIHLGNLVGALVITAAGNNNGRVHFPGRLNDTSYDLRLGQIITRTLAVGGMNQSGGHFSVSTFSGSNYGPQLDLSAPADQVEAAPPIADPVGISTSGTSAATALTSGVAALVQSVRPDLASDELHDILVETALATGQFHPDGRPVRGVNAWRALFRLLVKDSCISCQGSPEVAVSGATVFLASARARSATQAPAIHAAYLPLRPAAQYQITLSHSYNTFDAYDGHSHLNEFNDLFSVSVNPLRYHERQLQDPQTASSLNAASFFGGTVIAARQLPVQTSSGVITVTVPGSAATGQVLSIVLDTFTFPGQTSTLPSWGEVTILDITPLP